MPQVNRAVILAAGVGARLKWLTRNQPKALVRVGDAPAIVHVIRRLAAQGIRDIAVNLHHHAEQLHAALGDGLHFGVHLVFSPEKALLDSGGGVKQAVSLLPGEGLVAVHNADVLTDVDIRLLAQRCPAAGACLALVGNPDHHPQGDFSLRDGRVGQAAPGEPTLTFAGVSVWDASVFCDWQDGIPFSLVRPMHALMAEGRLAGVPHRGGWLDIGRPRDLIRARREAIRA